MNVNVFSNQPARIVFALFGALGLAAAAHGQSPARADKEINEILEPIRKKHHLPALAGALVTSKGLCAIGAVGVRKVGAKVAVTVEDRFHIGSDTKAMTATLIARLVEEGRLSWDTPLEKALPELAGSMAPELKTVTLVHLLTHHAGLPANLKGGWRKVPGDTPRKQRAAVLKAALGQAPATKPGEKYEYSNLGYVIAGAVAERAADASWEDLMRKKLFAPLGMDGAGFGPPGTAAKIDQPWPHDGAGDPVEPGPGADNPAVMGPSGNVHCSLPDWARFIADQLKGGRGGRGLLKAETYKKLQQSPFRDHFYTPGGWTGQEIPGGVLLAHGGSNQLNYALALLVPGKDIAVLVATNRGGDIETMDRICAEAAEALLKHHGRNKKR